MSFTERIFDGLFGRWMETRLRVHVAGLGEEAVGGMPYLYCANHESWWDGFLIRYLHQRLRPGAPFRAVMLQGELRRRPFLRTLGAVGLEPGSVASGRRLLKELAQAPRDAGVAFFPQGRIRPGHLPPLGFQSGLVHAVRAMAPVLVVPVGIRILPGKDHRMDAFLSVGTVLPVIDEPPTLWEMEQAVAVELEAIHSFVRRLEEDAAEFWPEAAGMLPRGPALPWSATSDVLPFSRN